MSLKRLVLFTTALLLGLGWTLSAQAQTAKYSLTGGGGQIQIGGGLPLPIQLTNPTATGTVFPQLLIPAVPGKVITGTTVMAAQRKLAIPPAVLSKPPAQLTLGQFGQNPTLYAVATNLNWVWPTAPAVLSTLARTGAKTTTFVTPSGNNIRYSNVLAQKFGGPARIAIAGALGSGIMTNVAVTIYGIAVPGPGNPPCTHTALTPVPFPGPGNPACVAGIAQALPTGFAAGGWVAGNFITTPGGTPAAVLAGGPVPGVGIGKFGPNGDVTFFTYTPAGTMAGFTNMASSFGYPWTTGMLTISAPFAAGAPEIFMITGKDSRTAGGAGTIQLVSGALSQRTLSGPNANRGWIRLDLGPFVPTPAVPPSMLVGGAGLMALAFGYAVRRFRA